MFKASPILSDFEALTRLFWATRPGMPTLMDPQQRLLLECGWEALGTRGLRPIYRTAGRSASMPGPAYTTCSTTSYPNRDTLDTNDNLKVTPSTSMGGFQLMVGQHKDYLPTRRSLQTNLTAQHHVDSVLYRPGSDPLPCQSPSAAKAIMFLAGGSSVSSRTGPPPVSGGRIVAPDGHCRTFDVRPKETIFGSGVRRVFLKDWMTRSASRHILCRHQGSAAQSGGMKSVHGPDGDGQAAS